MAKLETLASQVIDRMEKEGKKGKQKKEGGRVDEGDVSTLQAFKQQQNPEGKFIMYTMAPIALQYKQAFQFQPVKQTSNLRYLAVLSQSYRLFQQLDLFPHTTLRTAVKV